MLTDAALKEAARVAMECRLPTFTDEEPHVFSDRFERKMNKLIRRAEHPLAYQSLRIAAVIVLTLATLFGAVLAASPEVRAEVIEWIRSFSTEGSIQYVTDGDQEKIPPYDYRLRAVPEGYEEYSVRESFDSKHYTYLDAEGKVLKLAYKYPLSSGGVVIDGNYEYRTGDVNGNPAELYLSPDGSEASYIVWNDPETKAILWIGAWKDEQGLIALAETVERIHK